MRYLNSALALLPVILVDCRAALEQPAFWYPNPGASCGHIKSAVGGTRHDAFIGVCAAVSSASRIYGCPVDQSHCETSSQTCSAGELRPSDQQRLCGTDGEQWCCLASESCPSEMSQRGICIAPFSNPVDDIDVQEALSVMQLASFQTPARGLLAYLHSMLSEPATRFAVAGLLLLFFIVSTVWSKWEAALPRSVGGISAELDAEKLRKSMSDTCMLPEKGLAQPLIGT